MIGIGVVTVAENLGFLPSDRLYRYVLMLQFALPPAMNIGKGIVMVFYKNYEFSLITCVDALIY